MRIAFTTLGCKINQFETDVLRKDFESRGNIIVPFNAEADIYIINTCSVTAKSDYQCRQAIRSAVRRGRGAKIVVTGCYAELQPDEIKKIPGVDIVCGNSKKIAIPDQLTSQLFPAQAGAAYEPVADGVQQSVRSRTRGFLKVQDGCDNNCAYCIVPLARGRSRSVPVSDIIREFNLLVQSGCLEIVLTGIHIGSYGADLGAGINLTELIRILLAERGNARIRLSSIEPGEVTQELVGFLGKGLCRHLHIPLQSGDNTILASMQRNYTADFYRELVAGIAARTPGIALGADVIVGFPGEGDHEFLNTMRLVKESPLTHLHVFSYSSRPGTRAADMEAQVPEKVKKMRNEALRKLAREKNLVFREMHVGAEVNVVVEAKVDAGTGLLTGLTDNYIRVHISGAQKEHINKKKSVRINHIKDQDNFAEIL
jgi:threonylcarbamoyladenosine tRNA methylthiotransferase MtaB